MLNRFLKPGKHRRGDPKFLGYTYRKSDMLSEKLVRTVDVLAEKKAKHLNGMGKPYSTSLIDDQDLVDDYKEIQTTLQAVGKTKSMHDLIIDDPVDNS